MNIIDLFSGVGGLGLGFEQAGFKNICSIDNWHDAIKTHNFNRKEINGYVEDIGSFKNEHLTSLLSKHKIDGVQHGLVGRRLVPSCVAPKHNVTIDEDGILRFYVVHECSE